jgi:hypothetical protein
MNLPPSARQIVHPQRLAAHLDSTLRQLSSYLQYIGLAKYKKAIEALKLMQEVNVSGSLERPAFPPSHATTPIFENSMNP